MHAGRLAEVEWIPLIAVHCALYYMLPAPFFKAGDSVAAKDTDPNTGAKGWAAMRSVYSSALHVSKHTHTHLA